MNRYRMQFAPQTWKPKLNPFLIRCLRPLRLRNQRRTQQIAEVEVVGGEHVREAVERGDGVLIMPNHSSHADPFSIYAAADTVDIPLYVMATWHVFHDKPFLVRRILQWHGCFSVDREANDLNAFREAVGILQRRREPLVIFPEGEIYHCNARVTPFREGAAAIAIAAARRAERPIVCVPCAITYRYLDDPTEFLIELMGDLEEAILWRRQTEYPLDQRIYRFAEALLAVKEIEYLGTASSGPLPDRIRRLGDSILSAVERRHQLDGVGQKVPERVKAARRVIIEKMTSGDSPDTGGSQVLHADLEDLFLVVQSFSYPGDYVNERPTLERLAETLDKFEEDVLRRPTASIRGRRRVLVQFADPVSVPSTKERDLAGRLTQQIESSVQALLDQQFSTGDIEAVRLCSE